MSVVEVDGAGLGLEPAQAATNATNAKFSARRVARRLGGVITSSLPIIILLPSWWAFFDTPRAYDCFDMRVMHCLAANDFKIRRMKCEVTYAVDLATPMPPHLRQIFEIRQKRGDMAILNTKVSPWKTLFIGLRR
jgi:hypothetical protein